MLLRRSVSVPNARLKDVPNKPRMEEFAIVMVPRGSNVVRKDV